MKLHELTGAIADVQDLLDRDEIDAATAADTIAGLELAFEEKGLGIGRLLQNLEAEEKAIAAHASAAAERASALKKKREGLLDWLHANMKRTGILSISAPDIRLAVKGKPAALLLADDFDIGAVPEAYVKTEVVKKLDKVALKKAIADEGLVVPGATLEADATRLEVKA